MRLIVGKLGDSQEVPGNNPFHAFALAVGNEFNRLKGMQGREHSATLVGRATPFGQLHDSTPFQPGDTAKEQQKRGKNAPKQEQQKQEDPKKQGGGVSFSAGFSSGKKGKGTPEAAAIVLNATGPLDLKAPSKGALSTENLSRKELENLRLAVRPLRPAAAQICCDNSVAPIRAGCLTVCRARSRPWRPSLGEPALTPQPVHPTPTDSGARENRRGGDQAAVAVPRGGAGAREVRREA